MCSVLVEYHMYIINSTDVFYWSDTGERLNIFVNDCISQVISNGPIIGELQADDNERTIVY